jgi:hypothetical protein
MKQIPLSKGLYALVSDEDFEKVNQYKWYASLESRGTKYYAIRRVTIDGKRVKIRMHRFIMGLPIGLYDERVVNHINDCPLDNRRENLEIVTEEENRNLSKGFRGSKSYKKGKVNIFDYEKSSV